MIKTLSRFRNFTIYFFVLEIYNVFRVDKMYSNAQKHAELTIAVKTVPTVPTSRTEDINGRPAAFVKKRLD